MWLRLPSNLPSSYCRYIKQSLLCFIKRKEEEGLKQSLSLQRIGLSGFKQNAVRKVARSGKCISDQISRVREPVSTKAQLRIYNKVMHQEVKERGSIIAASIIVAILYP